MIDIQKIAREAGIHIYPEYTEMFERFAALIREAVVQELVEGSGEPATVTVLREIPYYTADQLAGAVARERERIAEYIDRNLMSTREYAEAIRSGDGPT